MSIALEATIQRSDIIHMLENFSDEKVIFLSAPAGYGKTVAVRQWLDGKKCSKAFLSLDEYDNNIPSFCERFCSALYSCQPQNSAMYEMLSHPAFPSAPDEFALRVIGAMSAKKRAVFVIDDLHFLLDDGVMKLLVVFMQRLPKAIQMVLISRNEPPTEFSRIWDSNSFAFVGADSLRFSDVDIMQLYRKHGKDITPKEKTEVLRFTGGWPIGVGALLLSGGKPSANVLEYLDDFILPNIWEQCDGKTKEFLLCTAMARELPPSLCNILAGISDSETILRRLMQAGVFVSLTKDGAFHYHHLFRSFIRNKVKERGDAFICNLLVKEGLWHLSGQDFYSAAECFIRCGNADGIAKCFDMLEYTDRNEFVIERMLPIIKSPAIQTAADQYPSLFYLMAWAAFAEGRDRDMIRYMDSYYSRYQEIAARDPAHAHNIIYMRIFDFRVSILELIAEAAQFPVIPAVNGVQGSITMNMPVFHRSICDFSELATEDVALLITDAGKKIGWLFGEEWELLSRCLTAGLLFEQGQLDKAYTYALSATEESKAHFSSELKFCAMSMLVCVLEAFGRRSEAAQVLLKIGNMIEHDRAYYLCRNHNALSTRHRISLGGASPAQDWILSRTPALHEGAYIHNIYEAFTTARAYIATDDLESAIILLTKLLRLARRFNRPLDIIEAQILLAVSYWKNTRGFLSKAMDALSDALVLAHAYGFTQLFINEGAEIYDMLFCWQNTAQWQDGNSDELCVFVNKLCFMLRDKKEYASVGGKRKSASYTYTDRQKAVMILLCEGKSFKEIAHHMGIKLPTVRSHIALIYEKLNGTNKIDPIAKIKTLDLIH